MGDLHIFSIMLIAMVSYLDMVNCARRKPPNVEAQLPCGGGDNTQLKCYDCESMTEPGCGNPDEGQFTLFTHEVIYCPDGIVYCRTDTFFYNGTMVYDRRCAEYNPTQTGCTAVMDASGQIRNVCYCNKHYCNQATTMTKGSKTVLFLLVLLMLSR